MLLFNISFDLMNVPYAWTVESLNPVITSERIRAVIGGAVDLIPFEFCQQLHMMLNSKENFRKS